jgi:hypothetical protein
LSIYPKLKSLYDRNRWIVAILSCGGLAGAYHIASHYPTLSWSLKGLLIAATLLLLGALIEILGEASTRLLLKILGLSPSEQSYADLSERRSQAESKIAADPKNSQAAWDVARFTLEQYFNRNLQQVRHIFVVAVVVMLIGFAFVLFGVSAALLHPDQRLGPIVATLSGIITQFIGVTFMQIHRATMEQANQYVGVLERINIVGMSVQIVESVPKNNPLYVETKAEMARLLLDSINKTPSPKTKKAQDNKRTKQ